MRQIQPELQARLDSGATSLCRCWKILRRDGVEMGFTDHDVTLEFDGTEFLASSGMDASALQTSNGLSVDNAQVVGALSTEAISERDIRAGKYDGAEVFQWFVDWRKPELRVLMFRGSVGEIKRNDSSFEVELRGLSESLNTPVGRSILRTCDRVLGDSKCGVDVSDPAFFANAEVSRDAEGSVISVSGLGGYAGKWFQHGVLTWTSGANAGARAVVKADAGSGNGRVLTLWAEPAEPVKAGDQFTIVAGCDKRFATCKAKFSNILNFRGFPHLPTEDWVTAYPTDGAIHDGSSLNT